MFVSYRIVEIFGARSSPLIDGLVISFTFVGQWKTPFHWCVEVVVKHMRLFNIESIFTVKLFHLNSRLNEQVKGGSTKVFVGMNNSWRVSSLMSRWNFKLSFWLIDRPSMAFKLMQSAFLSSPFTLSAKTDSQGLWVTMSLHYWQITSFRWSVVYFVD